MKRKIQKKEANNKKVLVALSGGIDSALAAALLKRQGFNIQGVFMVFWNEQKNNANRCCSQEAQTRARKIARKLNIPFYVLDMKKEFKKEVVGYFLKELEAGRTPNPCVVCNKKIKFGLLLKKALASGADYVATGHYAKIIQNPKIKNQNDTQKIPLELNENNNSNRKIFQLLEGKDKNKDQSYFLWQLSQKQLSRIIFPLAQYTKNQVRKLAKKFSPLMLKIPESQEICFIKETLDVFIEKNVKKKWGEIRDENKNILGKHPGLPFFTIGQRKNIIPYLENKWKSKGPYFVFKKDTKNNVLFISKTEKLLLQKELTAKNVCWVSGNPPKTPLKILAKIRYNQPTAEAIIKKTARKNVYRVIFDIPQKAVTPGQSVVFYFGGGNAPLFRAGMKAAKRTCSKRDTSPLQGGIVHKKDELLGGGIIS